MNWEAFWKQFQADKKLQIKQRSAIIFLEWMPFYLNYYN